MYKTNDVFEVPFHFKKNWVKTKVWKEIYKFVACEVYIVHQHESQTKKQDQLFFVTLSYHHECLETLSIILPLAGLI